MNQEKIDKIKKCVDNGSIDPTEISRKLGGISAVEVAYIIDIEDLMPSIVDRGKLYQAENFVDLVAKVPGVLKDTRLQFVKQFHENYVAKLFSKALETYLNVDSGSILKINQRQNVDSIQPTHFVSITYKAKNGVEIRYLNGNSIPSGYLRINLKDNYTVVFDSSVLNNRKAVFNRLSTILLSRKASFVDCSSEELPIVQQIESAFLLSLADKAPVYCKFTEPLLVEWLAQQNKIILTRDEVVALAHLFLEKGLSILTPARIQLYKSSKGQYNKGLLTDIFFKREEPSKLVSNINELMEFNIRSNNINDFIENIPFDILMKDVPIKVAPLDGSYSLAHYLMKFYPGYGVINKEKAEAVFEILKKSKRSRLYLSFFYDPSSPIFKYHPLASSEDSISKYQERGLENARRLIRYYVQKERKTLEDIKFEDIAFLFANDADFSVCGLNLPTRARVIMNKLFPGEYGCLSFEVAKELLLIKEESILWHRKRAYFDDGSDDVDIYTEDEILALKERCRNNSRMAIDAYLVIHPEKDLDSLKAEDLNAISTKMFNVFGGKSVRICLNRLMPDKFLILNEEKALQYFQAKDRDRFALTRRYIPDYKHISEDDLEYSQALYTEKEIELIRQRTIKNLQTLVRALVKLKGFRFLEEIGRHNTEWLFDFRLLGNGFPPRADGSKNFIVLMRKLFFDDFGVLTEEKYYYWKHQATGPKKRYLSNAFLFIPDSRDGWTEEEKQELISRSQKNASLALKLYMKEEGMVDIHNITKAMLIKGIGEGPLLRIFDVFTFRAVLDRIFSDDFAVLTDDKVKSYFSLPTRRKQTFNYAYFGLNADRQLDAYATESNLKGRWIQNAVLTFLEFLRINGLSWAIFRDDGNLYSGLSFALPDSVFRIFQTDNHHIMWIKEQIAPFLHPIEDVEAFYWLNLADNTNLVKFWQLDNSKNTYKINEVPIWLRARIAKKIFEHGYPFNSDKRNALVAEAKSLLITSFRTTDKLDGFEEVFSLACHDTYAIVRRASWQRISQLSQCDVKITERNILAFMRSSGFSGVRVKDIPPGLEEVVRGVAGRVNSDLIRLLEIFKRKRYLTRDWRGDQSRLIKNAFQEIGNRDIELDKLVASINFIVENEFVLFYNKMSKALKKNVSLLTVSQLGILLPSIPSLVFSSDSETKEVGTVLIENLRLAYPALNKESQIEFQSVLRDIKDRVNTGRF